MSVSLDTCWKRARKVFKTVLRFFNLLEPDLPYMVLSLSKVSVWATLGLTVWVVVTGHGLAEVGAALLSNVGSIANYAYRRKVQVQTRTGAYGGFNSDPLSEEMPSSDIGVDPTESPYAQ